METPPQRDVGEVIVSLQESFTGKHFNLIFQKQTRYMEVKQYSMNIN